MVKSGESPQKESSLINFSILPFPLPTSASGVELKASRTHIFLHSLSFGWKRKFPTNIQLSPYTKASMGSVDLPQQIRNFPLGVVCLFACFFIFLPGLCEQSLLLCPLCGNYNPCWLGGSEILIFIYFLSRLQWGRNRVVCFLCLPSSLRLMGKGFMKTFPTVIADTTFLRNIIAARGNVLTINKLQFKNWHYLKVLKCAVC